MRTSSHGAKTISTFSPTSSAVGYSEMLSCIWQIQFYGSRCEQTETASLFWIEVCNVFESDQRNGQRQPFVYRHVRRVKAAGGRCGDAAAAARRWDCYCCSRSKLPTPGDSTVYQATDVAGSARRLGDPSQSLTHLSRCFGAEPRGGAK